MVIEAPTRYARMQHQYHCRQGRPVVGGGGGVTGIGRRQGGDYWEAAGMSGGSWGGQIQQTGTRGSTGARVSYVFCFHFRFQYLT